MRLTAAEWKAILCTLFACFLAESEGHPIPTVTGPESSSKMDIDRMNSLIEFCYWIGTQIGIEFSD